jgi:phosphopantothenoylcysteine decarboxylase/phosphopantothenate--cysteine ligase
LAAFRALYNKSIEELRDDGIRRMEMAGADMIAVNDVGKAGSGFDVETNELHLFDTRGDYTHLPLTEKFRAAELLVDYMAERISRPG